MATVGMIAGMALVLAALRLGGFLLADLAVPPAWEEALTFVPIATLTALIASSFLARPADVPPRLAAGIAAATIAVLTRRAWLCIVGGLAVYLLLRAL